MHSYIKTSSIDILKLSSKKDTVTVWLSRKTLHLCDENSSLPGTHLASAAPTDTTHSTKATYSD